MSAPLNVFKDSGQWWYECRLCNWVTPQPGITHGIAIVRAEMHYDVAHQPHLSPMQRSYR